MPMGVHTNHHQKRYYCAICGKRIYKRTFTRFSIDQQNPTCTSHACVKAAFLLKEAKG